MRRHLSHILPLALLAFALPACDSDDPDDGAGEEELITFVEVTLTPTDGGDDVTLIANDENGDGIGVVYSPNPAVLDAGTTYNGSIRLLDRSDPDDEENITEEIEEEAEEHLFAYSSSVSGVAVTITDSESDYTSETDNDGDYSVGLAFQVTVDAGASGTGNFSATLYHFDDAPKTSSTDTSDETDIELSFPISVQ